MYSPSRDAVGDYDDNQPKSMLYQQNPKPTTELYEFKAAKLFVFHKARQTLVCVFVSLQSAVNAQPTRLLSFVFLTTENVIAITAIWSLVCIMSDIGASSLSRASYILAQCCRQLLLRRPLVAALTSTSFSFSSLLRLSMSLLLMLVFIYVPNMGTHHSLGFSVSDSRRIFTQFSIKVIILTHPH